jgi:hypothetical protein
LKIPVFFTEQTHRAWTRMVMPRTTMSYAKWLDLMQREKEQRAEAAVHVPAHVFAGVGDDSAGRPASLSPDIHPTQRVPQLPTEVDPQHNTAEASVEMEATDDGEECAPNAPRTKADPSFLPAVEYFRAGHRFCIGEIDVDPFTIPHDAADPCGFVFHGRAESIKMAIATDLGYVPPNVQRVLSRVGHLSNAATAEFLLRDYDGGAHTIVLGHLSEANNLPELARLAAEQAVGDRMSLLGNRIVLAAQDAPLEPICL